MSNQQRSMYFKFRGQSIEKRSKECAIVTKFEVVEALRKWFDKEYMDEFFKTSWYTIHSLGAPKIDATSKCTSVKDFVAIRDYYRACLKREKFMTPTERKMVECFEYCLGDCNDETILAIKDFSDLFYKYYRQRYGEYPQMPTLERIEKTLELERNFQENIKLERRNKLCI